MIDSERIFEIWETSSRLPQLPREIRELIQISFIDKKEKPTPSANLLNYIRDRQGDLAKLLSIPPFNNKIISQPVREFINNCGYNILRNLLLVLWFNQLSSAGNHDRINYQTWNLRNLMSAFFAYFIAQKDAQLNQDNLFLQAYLQDVSLCFLSRTLPEQYDELVNSDRQTRFKPEYERKIIGTSHGELTGKLLNQWGFPPAFTTPLRNHHYNVPSLNPVGGHVNESSVIPFSQLAAIAVLSNEKDMNFRDIETKYSQYFGDASRDFHKLIFDVVQTVSKIGLQMGFSELPNLSIAQLLNKNAELKKSRLLPYETLVDEVAKSQKKIEKLEAEIARLQDRLKTQQIHDPVTGLYNHAYFMEYLDQAVRESARYEHPLSLVLLDIDNFKLFNKTYGYPTGTDLLLQLGGLLRQNLRESDVVARMSNDEFGILLPHTGVPQSRFVSEKIVKLIFEKQFQETQVDRSHQISASTGAATLIPSISFMQSDRLLRSAGMALQNSKQSGGNRSSIYQD